MIHILVEKNYSDNNRFHRLLDGIGAIAGKRRIEIAVYTDIAALSTDVRIAIVVCQSLRWSADKVKRLNEQGIHPLVFDFSHLDTMYDYSSIAPNYTKAAYRLTKLMLSKKIGKVAVLGYNEDSLPDKLKLTGIRYAVNEAGQELEIFRNNGDILRCFEDFSKRYTEFDSVVCCNDNVATMLHCKYHRFVEDRQMCSCSGIKLSEFFRDPYPVCRVDHFIAGQKLASLYLFLMKEEHICSTVMTFDMKLCSYGTDKVAEPDTVDTGYSASEVDFYGDKGLNRMEKLDRMLTECDATDINILSDAVAGMTYANIAEKRYLAINTVKYRIKKMQDTAGVESRKELIALIIEYGLRFEVD